MDKRLLRNLAWDIYNECNLVIKEEDGYEYVLKELKKLIKLTEDEIYSKIIGDNELVKDNPGIWPQPYSVENRWDEKFDYPYSNCCRIDKSCQDVQR
jgi:hypothetical protein